NGSTPGWVVALTLSPDRRRQLGRGRWPVTWPPGHPVTAWQASARDSGTRAGGPRRRRGASPAGEPGRPLLHERGHALPLIFSAEQAGEQLALPGQAAGEVPIQPAVDGELRRPQRQGGTADVGADHG